MELQTGVLSTLQNIILVTSLRHQYDVMIAAITYLRHHWHRSMADSVCNAHQFFNDITTEILTETLDFLKQMIILKSFHV